MKSKSAVALAAMSFVLALHAVEVTSEQARTAARNWVRRSPARMGETFKSSDAEPAETARDGSGRAIYHVVNFDGGGFVVTAGDTRLAPVVAFSSEGRFVADEANPLYVLLQGDQAAAVSVVNSCESQSAPSGNGGGVKTSPLVESRSAGAFAAAESEWRSLLAEDTLSGVPIARSSEQEVSDVRVDRLVQSHWDQSTWGNDWNQPDVYNYYTPNNYVCGCVATTGAQIMHFWRYPTGSVAMFSNDCMIDGIVTTMSSIEGSFDWNNMPLCHETAPNIAEAQQKAIGMLTYNVGVAVGMNWTSSGSASSQSKLVPAMKERFGYQSGVFVYYNLDVGGSGGLSSFRNALYSNLDAGMPVMVSISWYGEQGTGHSVIADGYGYASGTLYTHLNMGWSGYSEAWYNLINEEIYAADDEMSFTRVEGIGFNIHPTTAGDVVSGRVLTTSGRPVSGAEVCLYDASNRLVASTKSNSKGIYSFRITSVGRYSVKAGKGTDASNPVYYANTGLSSSGTYGYDGGTGNRWGLNITLDTADAGDEWDPVDDTADGGTLLVPAATEQTHGAHTVSSTDLNDFFRISMTSGRVYSFQATSSDMDLDLYASPDLSTRVAHKTNGAKMEYTPTDSGMHYLRVKRFATASATYSLKYSYASRQATYLRVEGYYPDVLCKLSADAVNFMSRVDCDGEWTVGVDDTSWGVNLTTTSGSGSGYFYFSVPENTGYNRRCVFTVKAGSLTARKHLTQEGPLGERPAVVKVTLGKNGGTGGDNYVTATYGKPMPTPRTAPKKDGYAFAGYWDTTKEGGRQYYDANMKSVRNWDRTSATTLWAKWEKAVKVRVTLGKNGGSGGDSYVTATTGKPMPTPRTAPKLSGWTFGGYWDTLACDEKGNPKGKQYYDANMKSVRNWDKTAATTLWAKWTVRVKLGKNGGAGGDNYVTVIKGRSFPKRTMPTKSGYKFCGYYVSASKKTGQCYKADGTGTASMKWSTGGSPTIWALWTKMSSLVEVAPAAFTAPVSAAPTAAAPASLAAGLYSGVLADGSGSFWLMLDEPEAGYARTAYLYIASEDGSLTAECVVEEPDGVLLLTTEDGALYVFDSVAGRFLDGCAGSCK